MTSPQTMTEDEWIEAFKPLVNPVDASFGYDFGDGCTLIETYDEHLAYVKGIEENRVWTVIDGDDGEDQYVINGFHHVNRIGYIVTERPWTDAVEVRLDQ